jgi:NAD(P)-dependent dehydrogenase (short-subunit alcohol dehydrogenase family)
VSAEQRLFAGGNFAGRVAFITGGASGIGNGLARLLAERGARVAIADVRAEAIEAAAHALGGTGAEILPIVLDVTDRQAMINAADLVEKRFGAVHLVVNNAGIAQVGTPLDQVDEDTYRWMFEVNVHGVFNGMAAFAPRLKSNGAGGGHIVNTSSIAGLFMMPDWHIGLYAASKMAVIPLSLGMRLALASHNIGVSVVCPGRVWSDLRRNSAALAPHAGPQVSNLPDDIDDKVMTPARAADLVLAGVIADRALILTHPEHAQEVADYHALIMDEFTYWATAAKETTHV